MNGPKEPKDDVATRLLDELRTGVAEKDWSAWAAEAASVLRAGSAPGDTDMLDFLHGQFALLRYAHWPGRCRRWLAGDHPPHGRAERT